MGHRRSVMVMVFHVFVYVPGAGQRLLFEFVELAAAGRRAVHVRQWRHERLQREPFTSFVVFFSSTSTGFYVGIPPLWRP